MSLILTTLIGFAGLEPEHNRPPYISPKVICDDTQMTIVKDAETIEPEWYGAEFVWKLAVITPDKHFLYLADQSYGTVIPQYWAEDEISLQANELYSIDNEYETGTPILIKVFQEPGIYQFVFSDNLHTEYDNSLTFFKKVTYLGKDHPDCP